MLYTLNLYNVICQLCFHKVWEKKRADLQGELKGLRMKSVMSADVQSDSDIKNNLSPLLPPSGAFNVVRC